MPEPMTRQAGQEDVSDSIENGHTVVKWFLTPVLCPVNCLIQVSTATTTAVCVDNDTSPKCVAYKTANQDVIHEGVYERCSLPQGRHRLKVIT